MAKFVAAMREEIARVARKQVRPQVSATKRAAAQHRRDIAALKRLVSSLSRRVAFLESQEKRRAAQPVASASEPVRFSPRWIKAHRARLGLSAQDYGKLIGVSTLTVYNWEAGKARPRESLRTTIAAIRSLRKREALRRLEMLER
jgi:DNA-binding transcriptional regulator YiaG